jgi:hypothetical protein
LHWNERILQIDGVRALAFLIIFSRHAFESVRRGRWMRLMPALEPFRHAGSDAGHRRRGQLYLLLVIEALPGYFPGLGKLRQHLVDENWIKKIIDHEMRERFCSLVGVSRCLLDLRHFRQRQERSNRKRRIV